MNDINYYYSESQTKKKSREVILTKSIELFSLKGIDSISFSEISEVCEITKRNLYRYYPTKEDLVIDCVYYAFYRSYSKDIHTSDKDITGLDELKKILIGKLKLDSTKELEIILTRFIMFFDIYIASLGKDNPAFIKYISIYRQQIEDAESPAIKKALDKGIIDGTIKIKPEEIDIYDSYIKQSMFSILMRINIKEYENPSINIDLAKKHVEIILEHLGGKNWKIG